MSPIQIVLEGVLLPMAAGLLPLAIGMRLWRREAPAEPSGWGLAIATAIAFALALRVQQGDEIWQLRQKWQWLWVVGGAAAIAGTVVALLRHFVPRMPTVVAGVLAALLVGGATLFLLTPPGFSDNAGRAIVVLVVAGAGWCVTWPPRWSTSKDSAVHAGTGWADGLAFWLAASGLSGVVLASGFAKLAVPLGAIAALSMAAAVLSLRGRRDLGFAGLATLGAVLAAAAVVGWAYDLAEIPAWCFLALTFAPAAMRIPMPSGWRFRSALRLAIVLVVVGAAAGSAVVASGMFGDPEDDESSEYDYYGAG